VNQAQLEHMPWKTGRIVESTAKANASADAAAVRAIMCDLHLCRGLVNPLLLSAF